MRNVSVAVCIGMLLGSVICVAVRAVRDARLARGATEQIALVRSTAWWLLAKTIVADAKVEAFGPYPSEELCRAAGHEIVPNDKRFLTAQERADADRARDTRLADDDRVRAAWLATHRPTGGTLALPSGRVEIYDAGGFMREAQYWNGAIGTAGVPARVAITGCVSISTGDGR
jgi:hypothetical protein